MTWIVVGEENGKCKLVSKKASDKEKPGILPKGSFITIEGEDKDSKFILRVDNSEQYEPYKPSPLVIDMDLKGLYQDVKCQNILFAYRVRDITNRNDGKIDFILPQLIARRSTQEEVDLAFGSIDKGPKVFLATIHAGQNQLLVDENLNYITTRLPDDMFFHQMLICGKTGSGKTVSIKYLLQYFTEEKKGAVLAINVKDIDLLQLDKPSFTTNPEILSEWKSLGVNPHGIENFVIYYPANTTMPNNPAVNKNLSVRITLKVKEIDPESLNGLLQNITEIGAQLLPDIFRYWQEKIMTSDDTFSQFVDYFKEGIENPRFPTLNIRGDISEIPLAKGTFNNILRNLIPAEEFFDNPDSISLESKDILSPGKLSVINVTGDKGVQFGSVLLRHLLKRIVKAKSERTNNTPVLVIIDEVHQFYNTESSKEALGILDTICRTGRSQEIGVIFSSQNQEDIPQGLSNVINTKLIFRSDGVKGTSYGITTDEIQSLKVGYSVVNIHNLPQLKITKFPVALAGVIENG